MADKLRSASQVVAEMYEAGYGGAEFKRLPSKARVNDVWRKHGLAEYIP